jgi:cyanate lyase
MKLTKPQAANAADLFRCLSKRRALLNEVPMRGAGAMPPTDPLIYRCTSWSWSMVRPGRR